VSAAPRPAPDPLTAAFWDGCRDGAHLCIEATRQLRGGCGDRQVPGAEVAVWTNAVGPFAAAVLMTA
jgi:hypothetical protein